MSLAFLHSCKPVWKVERTPGKRVCRTCLTQKPVEDFYLKGDTLVDGTQRRHANCKTCMTAKQLARYHR